MVNIVKVNVENKNINEEDSDRFGTLDYSISHHMEEETYEKDVFSPENSVCISSGPLAGSRIPGMYRLIISGRSPLTHTFFFTTLGGGSMEFYPTSIDTLVIKGKSKKPLILLVKYEDDELKIEFKNISRKELFKLYEKKGVYSLQKYLIKNYSKFYKELRYRAIVVGPAAFNTNMGAINSVVIRNNKIDHGSEGWGGRGGFGSLLAQAHNVCAVMFGGDYDDREFEENIRDLKVRNGLFKDLTGKEMTPRIVEKTKKYREKGTFGGNNETLVDDIPMFNWQNIYLDKEERVSIHKKFVKEHYLKQFKKEILEHKRFKTCGENCPAVCKKVYNNRNKDYETYNSCGPNSGVFDQRAAELLAGTVDDMGFDSIEFGNIISTVFEGIQKGVLKPKTFKIEKEPRFDIESFKLKDSMHNAKIGAEIIKKTAFGKIPFLNKGIRNFSKKKNLDFAAYFSFGEEGCISPNQYWLPGFLVPLPIQGKFCTYYQKPFHAPEEMGELSTERLIKELYNENTGICRFHRKWCEEILNELIKELLGEDIDYYEHIKNLVKKIKEYNELANNSPVYWETKRTKDIVHTHLLASIEDVGESNLAVKWKEKYEKSFEKASREYWSKLLKGVENIL